MLQVRQIVKVQLSPVYLNEVPIQTQQRKQAMFRDAGQLVGAKQVPNCWDFTAAYLLIPKDSPAFATSEPVTASRCHV